MKYNVLYEVLFLDGHTEYVLGSTPIETIGGMQNGHLVKAMNAIKIEKHKKNKSYSKFLKKSLIESLQELNNTKSKIIEKLDQENKRLLDINSKLNFMLGIKENDNFA